MKFIDKIKNTIQSIHWPNTREVVSDTFLTISVTAVLALAISGWTSVIEYVIDWVLSLF